MYKCLNRCTCTRTEMCQYHLVTSKTITSSHHFLQSKSSFGSVASILKLLVPQFMGTFPEMFQWGNYWVHKVKRAGYQKNNIHIRVALQSHSNNHNYGNFQKSNSPTVTFNFCFRMTVVGSGVNIFIPGKNVFSKQSLDTAEELISPRGSVYIRQTRLK